MSDWLNTRHSFIVSFLLIASYTPTYAACNLENDSCLDLPTTNSDQIDEVVSDRSFYEEDALACLSTIVESGCKAVKSVTQLVRKHPLKAMTMLLALQHSSSPCRMACAEALSATNIELTVTFLTDGPAVPFLPIMISSQAERLNIDFRAESRECEECSIVSTVTVPPLPMIGSGTNYVWRAQGNKVDLNTLLSRLFLMPGSSNGEITISVIIRELDPPLLTVMGTIRFEGGRSYQAPIPNINQTLVYDTDGQAVRLLPMLLRDRWAQANATMVLGDELSGTLTSNATILAQTFTAGTWYIKNYSISLVERVLANLIFTPAAGYNNPIYLYPTIGLFLNDTRSSIKGVITLNPSTLTMLTSGQSSKTIAPSSSKASSATSAGQTTVITGSTKSLSTSPETQSTITRVATTSLKSISTPSSTSSLSYIGGSVAVTVATNISPSQTTSIDSSGVDIPRTSSTINESTTTSEIDRSSASFSMSTNDLPTIIGGVIGGVVLVGCAIAAGVVASMRKKSSSQEKDQKVKAVELGAQLPVRLNSDYAVLPIASPSDQNDGNQEINATTT